MSPRMKHPGILPFAEQFALHRSATNFRGTVNERLTVSRDVIVSATPCAPDLFARLAKRCGMEPTVS
jgi:hypothetical protein